MPRKRFTRRSHPQEYKGFQQLHRWLSRLDVEKDALHASPPIDRDHIQFFHRQADELFGCLVTSYRQQNIDIAQTHASLKESTEYFLDILKRYNVYQPREFTVVHNYADLTRNWRIVAPDITEAIHDSGLSPHMFDPSIRVFLNPGSYLDPGSRTRFEDCNNAIGFGIPLDTNVFQELSMPHIRDMQTNLRSDGTATLKMAYNMIPIHASFSSNYTQVEGPQYFKGNSTKNQWFNGTTHDSDKHAANLYILCKELGDTLQAYYAYMRNNITSVTNLVPDKLAFFTNDIIATYRCILLQVPVCVSKPNLNNKRVFHYHPAMNEISTKWKQLQLNELIEHNQDRIREINNVLNRGYFIQQSGRCVTFNQTSAIAEFLRYAMKTIRDTTMQFKGLSSARVNAMSVATYSKLASAYKATRLFNQQVANRSAQSLFIKPTATSPLFPDFFGDFLYSLRQTGGGEQVGGVTTEEEELVYGYNRQIAINNPTDYTTIDASIPDQHLPIMYVMNGIYTLLKARYPELSVAALKYMAEDIHSKLALYFSYAGVCLWSRPFLEAIIVAYETGVLHRMSHEEFLALYTPFGEEEDAKLENNWEWKLLEAQVEKAHVEPHIAALEAMIGEEIYSEPEIEDPIARLVKARKRTRKMRRSRGL